MTDELGERLAAAIDDAAAPVTAAEAMTRGKRYTRRHAVIAAGAALVAVVLTGVGIASVANRRSSGPARVFVGDTTTSTAAQSVPLSAHIEMPSTTIVAGASEKGNLVIENNTGKGLRFTGDGGCPGWAIVLRNSRLPQQAAFAMGCEGRSLVVGTGETKLPFTLLTTYQGCSSTGHPQGVLTPTCLPDPQGELNVAPPLPSGRYLATFFSQVPQFVPVASVPVRVVRNLSPTMAQATSLLTAYLAHHPEAVVHTAPFVFPHDEGWFAVAGSVLGAGSREIDLVILDPTPEVFRAVRLPFPDYDFARALPIQVADVTGDGLPDFLVRFEAADNQPGVVVSPAGFKLVPESADPADVYIGRDPTITDGRLRSTRNDCTPTCAQGHTTTVVWRYDPDLSRLVPR